MYYKFLVCTRGSEPFLLLFVISNYSLRWHFVPIKSRIWERNTIKSGEKDKRVNLWICVDIMKGNPKSKAEISPNLIFTSEPNIEGIDFSQYSPCHCPSTYSPWNLIILEQGTDAGLTICTKVCPLLLGFRHRLRLVLGCRSHLTSAIMCKNLYASTSWLTLCFNITWVNFEICCCIFEGQVSILRGTTDTHAQKFCWECLY